MSKSYIQKITPFIDNMRVGQDDGEEPAPAMTALKVGDIIVNGIKYHFNTSKENELLSYLQSLTYEGEEGKEKVCVIATYTTSEQYMIAMNQGTTYILGIADGGANFVYANESIPELGITTPGFQNLDENDNYVITWPVGVEREITSLIPSFSQINGVVIGVVEE